MINISSRDFTIGFLAYLQAKFGAINLQIQPIQGYHSELALHGVYHSSEFQAEFYKEHETKLNFLLTLRTPKTPANPFGNLGVVTHLKGLSRLIGDVREEIRDNDGHHYSVSCRIRRDSHQLGNMNIVFQDIFEYLVKKPFSQISRSVRQ